MHHVIREADVERVVIGINYCLDIGEHLPAATVNCFGASLSGAEWEMIFGRNARRLLKT